MTTNYIAPVVFARKIAKLSRKYPTYRFVFPLVGWIKVQPICELEDELEKVVMDYEFYTDDCGNCYSFSLITNSIQTIDALVSDAIWIDHDGDILTNLSVDTIPL